MGYSSEFGERLLNARLSRRGLLRRTAYGAGTTAFLASCGGKGENHSQQSDFVRAIQPTLVSPIENGRVTVTPDKTPTQPAVKEILEKNWERRRSKFKPRSVAVPKYFSTENNWTTGEEIDQYTGKTINTITHLVRIHERPIQPWIPFADYADAYQEQFRNEVKGTYSNLYKGPRPPGEHSMAQFNEAVIDGQSGRIFISSRMPKIDVNSAPFETKAFHYRKTGIIRTPYNTVTHIDITGIEESVLQELMPITDAIINSLRFELGSTNRK